MWWVLLLLPCALGCLSRPQREGRVEAKIIYVRDKREANQILSKHQLEQAQAREADRKYNSRRKHLETAPDKFTKLFSGLADERGVQITSDMCFEERRDRLVNWISITMYGEYETVMEYLWGQELRGSLLDVQGWVRVDKLVESVVLCYYNTLLNIAVDETLLRPLLTRLVSNYTQIHLIGLAAENADYNSGMLTKWEPNELQHIPHICNIIKNCIGQFVFAMDPSNELIPTIPEYIQGTTMSDLITPYIRLKQLPIISRDGIQMAFTCLQPGLVEVMEINHNINITFHRRLEFTRKMMNSQFEDLVKEDGDVVVELAKSPSAIKKSRKESPSRKTEPQQHKEQAVRSEIKEIHEADRKPQCDPERLDLKAPKEQEIRKLEETETEAAIAQPTKKDMKQERIEKEQERQKRKHERHLAALKAEEGDDKDVKFYYSTKCTGANTVFNKNQEAQACRLSFPSSKRYQHSIYPEITASGATINFLCSLLVSGTPDYEGFLAAHADLGGKMVEKKNGNKLFFFDAPISYHKTLHRPHLSSKFDHILYRRFYRNCALHPYFFKLLN